MKKDKADLHCHSSSSGGAIGAPPFIARQFQEQGYRAFSLTEHSNFESLKAAQEAAEKTGIEYIPGIEMGVRVTDPDLPNGLTHVLAFYYDLTPELEEMFARVMKEIRDNRVIFLDRLRKQGITDISMQDLEDDIKKVFGEHDTWKHPLSMGPISDVLRDRGILPKDRSKTFREYFSEICPDLEEHAHPGVREAIDAVHRAGGVVVLAHPGISHLDSDDEKKDLLRIWLERYVDGLEVFHEKASPKKRELVYDVVREMKRPYTGGSDKHSYSADETRFSDAPYSCVESLREFFEKGECTNFPEIAENNIKR